MNHFPCDCYFTAYDGPCTNYKVLVYNVKYSTDLTYCVLLYCTFTHTYCVGTQEALHLCVHHQYLKPAVPVLAGVHPQSDILFFSKMYMKISNIFWNLFLTGAFSLPMYNCSYV